MKIITTLLVLSMSLPTFANNITCNVWASMWVSADGNMRMIDKISLNYEEGTTVRELSNGQTLTIRRYFDYVNISLVRQPTDSERKHYDSLKLETPLSHMTVSTAAGSLNPKNSTDSLELGSRDYHVSCKY